MAILCMILGTVCFAFFLFLYMTADDNIVDAMLKCCRETETENIRKFQLELEGIADFMKRTGDLKDKARIRQAKALKARLDASRKKLERLDKNKVGVFGLVPVAGYRLMQLLGWDGSNENVKKVYNQCLRFKEKKEAMNYTYYLISSLMGYVALGFVAFFAVTGAVLALGLGVRGLVVSVAVFILTVMAGYLPYDNVNTVVKNRKEDIESQFPQVVSKLTLLTVAGMEVSQAWKLTAGSGTGVLYEEMKRVLVDLDNNVLPVEAYTKFITRCDNGYATKLATAIIQNVSKGNSEIVSLFRRLNSESWMEHKHNARRMGEKISSKLMVPTLLLFVGIIILVIVPVVTGFNF